MSRFFDFPRHFPASDTGCGDFGAARSWREELPADETQLPETQLPETQLSPRVESGLPSATELEQTLKRLMQRISMLVQAEKCVFLLHDKERGELVARPPALGFSREQLRALRVPLDDGVAARAFLHGEPVVVDDATTLDAADKPWLVALDARNLIAYPLVLERRDEQERLADKQTVGVFLVVNKRGNVAFSPEDLRLLSVMARQVTAVIADAQIYLQLTEEKEQLQATLQSLGSGVVMVESTGHISLVNSAARALFGLEEGEGIGVRYDEVIEEEPIRKLLFDAVKGGKEGGVEIDIESHGDHEPRIYQAQTAFVRGERNGFPAVLGVVMIFNDITEIRNVERMKTAFVSTVSHELRTPLTSIKGFVSTLLQDTEGYFDAESRQEFYEIIDTECDRLRRLIDDLLNVSRIESGRALQMNWSLFEPLAVVEKVMQAQRSYTDKHHLMLDYSGEVPKLLGDSDKFDQILTNLLSNAIKYSPKGGEVRVVVDLTEHDLFMRISDQGIGIPRDKLPRIFEKFERIDNRDTRQAGGTGIGLFLVKHLVEQHQGEIKVESEIGKGSTFIVRLPLRPQIALDEMKEHGREA
ncbi:two-component system, OmpR family, phosphate regulon sensor histidine kinase PhoR [Abditibacterium utsteinense]|uniref:histidine kinase n=1 Tax=Abditibacterium utsteinense TaxID=1960156 RepID=A0A2S8SUM9_9BACT|nr:ATP-binding protein [Abditibacterium utsteinense]PQV64502.1 two-component system, OmpR family, phosphate regulon sensor histidine kinase PhoR [Abditibacterium utsteinense]